MLKKYDRRSASEVKLSSMRGVGLVFDGAIHCVWF